MDVVASSKTKPITRIIAASGRVLKSKQATHWAVYLLIWVAFFLRVIDLRRQSLWRDEVDAIRFSDWAPQELVAGLFHTGHNGPLFFLALRPWRILTGDSELALRYPSALWGTLVIPLGFILARTLGFSRRVGILLSLLLATSPYLIWYGQEAKMYTLLMALVMLAFIAYLKALNGVPPPLFQQSRYANTIWWIIFVVVTSLSFYTHILSPLMLLVYGGVALLYRERWRRHWYGWLISMLCLTLPYLPLAAWQAPLLLTDFQSGHPDYSAQQITSLLFQLYSTGLVTFATLTGSILYVFLLLCGLYLKKLSPNRSSLQKISRRRQRFILAIWTVLPPLAVYLISLRVEVFEHRYLIYITPAFYLLAVIGLILIRQYSPRLAGFCLGLMLLFNMIGVWQQRQPIKADFRSAAAYLANHSQPPTTIMIQTPYLQYTFDYYYRGEYELLEGLWTNDGKSEATVATEMTQRTGHLNDLWLVVSEEALWDQRGLTRHWLERQANLIQQASFREVELYHYRFDVDADRQQVSADDEPGNNNSNRTTSPLNSGE